jgi:hypothetical protein
MAASVYGIDDWSDEELWLNGRDKMLGLGFFRGSRSFSEGFCWAKRCSDEFEDARWFCDLFPEEEPPSEAEARQILLAGGDERGLSV